MEDKCVICENSSDNKVMTIKERIINKGDTFRYLKCSQCGALSLIDIPDDMSKWYPNNYNPYTDETNNSSVKFDIIKFLKFQRRKFLVEKIVNESNDEKWYKVLKDPRVDNLFKRLFGTKIQKHHSILDVGCAAGLWLDDLYNMGWENVTGVDLFFPDNRIRQTKWKFIKGEIFDIQNQKFDCIILNHSFEHMNNPISVLKKVNSLLNDDGISIISVPLAQGVAWRDYGYNFVQIDAPRHLVLYTTESMKMVCEKSGLYIDRTLYDSHEGIFYYSEELKNTNKSHSEIAQSFKHNELFAQRAEMSNRNHDGDEAVFYIRKV